MKFTLTMKDPDGVYEGLRSAAEDSIEGLGKLNVDEQRDLIDSRREELGEAVAPWVEYGEYIRVEFDTDAGTATVRKVKR